MMACGETSQESDFFLFLKMGDVTAKCAVEDDSIEKMDALKEGELSMARAKVSVDGWVDTAVRAGWIFSKSPWLASILSFPQSGQ